MTQQNTNQDIPTEFKDRLEKLKELRDMGIQTYPDRYERTHMAKDAKEKGETEGVRETDKIMENPKNEMRLSGRLVAFRSHGKISFAQLLDSSGKIQICFMKNVLGDDKYKLLKKIDVADFLGVEGELFKTKHGEITLLVSDYTLLSKALNPLPEKWHGLQDVEAKYRQRYLDLIMDPDTKKRFEFRSNFIRTLREFYWQNGFMEIECPVLGNAASGALAKPFVTHHDALDQDFYMRIAIETHQKEAIAGGFEKVFEIGKVFRNEGMDPSHLQEFTMNEFYAAYWNYKDLMKFTEEMFVYLLEKTAGSLEVEIPGRDGNTEKVDFKPPWKKVTMHEIIENDSGINIHDYPTQKELLTAIREKDIQIEDAEKLSRGNLIDNLYKKVSRPKLVHPTFLTKHPADLSPLARRNDENPDIVDRFQVVVNGWEIVNAYSELIDPLEQAKAFKDQAKAQERGDEEAHGKDDEFVTAMQHGFPPIAGWGMGIDRIIALLTGQDNLKDVVLFPLMRPQDDVE
jgi:lysyl-tRNA synthetase class 2